MIEMIMYSITTIYTPGPINFLGLKSGLNNNTLESLSFFAGIATAFWMLLLIFAYTGQAFIKTSYLKYISLG